MSAVARLVMNGSLLSCIRSGISARLASAKEQPHFAERKPECPFKGFDFLSRDCAILLPRNCRHSFWSRRTRSVFLIWWDRGGSTAMKVVLDFGGMVRSSSRRTKVPKNWVPEGPSICSMESLLSARSQNRSVSLSLLVPSNISDRYRQPKFVLSTRDIPPPWPLV